LVQLINDRLAVGLSKRIGLDGAMITHHFASVLLSELLLAYLLPAHLHAQYLQAYIRFR